jgi:hypothetical protein
MASRKLFLESQREPTDLNEMTTAFDPIMLLLLPGIAARGSSNHANKSNYHAS